MQLLPRIYLPSISPISPLYLPYISLQLLPRMREAGVAPDARAMATVAWAAGRGPGWPKALDLLREMRSTMAAADFYMMALGCRALTLPLPLTLTPEPLPSPQP